MLLSFKLIASCPLAHHDLQSHKMAGSDAKAALKGKRKVYWEGDGYKETNIYERKLLQSGNIISGPGIVESEDTIILVPEGRRFSVDKFLFGIIEKE